MYNYLPLGMEYVGRNLCTAKLASCEHRKWTASRRAEGNGTLRKYKSKWQVRRRARFSSRVHDFSFLSKTQRQKNLFSFVVVTIRRLQARSSNAMQIVQHTSAVIPAEAFHLLTGLQSECSPRKTVLFTLTYFWHRNLNNRVYRVMKHTAARAPLPLYCILW